MTILRNFKRWTLLVGLALCVTQMRGQVVTNSFWDNFFGQLGFDMSLQNPYGHDFKNVFPNGKSFGVDVGLGKWFCPEFGGRVKFNWENGILKNDHAAWLAPFDQPGENHRMGGYVAVVGDVFLSPLNLFGEYEAQRRWNIMAYPRAGVVYNFGTKKGSPLVGVGAGATYRIADKWSLYADVAYQMVSSGFTMDWSTSTGTGTGSNGYFDVNLGVQLNLGNGEFHKPTAGKPHASHAVVTNSFWSNWFAQAGLGMSLLNPYGCNFSNVFPNGKTLGINLGIGKWFTPEVAVRAGLNWQNGIVGNNHLDWLDASGEPGENHSKGGYATIYGDVFFNVHNIFGGYDPNRLWNATVFPRMGLDRNFAIGSLSPLVGVGTEHTFRLSDRFCLFATLAYQMTTSEFVNGKSWTGVEGGGSNGFFDLNIGLQIDLGHEKFHPVE